MKKHFSFFVFVLLCTIASAQVRTQYFDTPQDLEKVVGSFSKTESAYTLPALDKKALLAEDELTPQPAPFRFAINVPVTISSDQNGLWTENKDTRRWVMKITSKDAYSQTIIFRNPNLMPGATIHIVDGDQKMMFGPIDNTNWKGEKEKLISDIIPGETAYIIYTEPISKSSASKIEIMEICYGYKNVFEKVNPEGIEKNSAQDLTCSPLGDNWRAEARSVVFIISNGAAVCSGTLVNNTAKNFNPFVLTADHCGCDGGGTANFNFRFFFWDITCNTNSPNGGAQTFTGGSNFMAAHATTDFLLLQMKDDPKNSGVVFAGWSRSAVAPTAATMLHHPEGNTMRVASENNTVTLNPVAITTSPCGTIPISSAWRTIFDVGGIEPGSSGAPLFNPAHQLVGQLFGGIPQAGPDTDCVHGRFDKSWTGGGSNTTRLSNWLHPTSGTTPPTLGAITKINGNETITCSGSTYSIPDFRNPGALTNYTYTWTVSSNLTIVSGQNTHNPIIKGSGTGTGTISVSVSITGGIVVCTGTRTVTIGTTTPTPGAPQLGSPNCSSCSFSTFCSTAAGATSYQWQGYSSTTTTGPNIPMGVTTNLCVRAVFPGGCVSAYTCASLTPPRMCGCVGGSSDDRSAEATSDGGSTDELNAFEFDVMPNPTRSSSGFTIVLPAIDEKESYAIQLMDTAGKLVFEQSGLSAGNHEIQPATDLAPGVYVIRARSTNGLLSSKQIVIVE